MLGQSIHLQTSTERESPFNDFEVDICFWREVPTHGHGGWRAISSSDCDTIDLQPNLGHVKGMNIVCLRPGSWPLQLSQDEAIALGRRKVAAC